MLRPYFRITPDFFLSPVGDTAALSSADVHTSQDVGYSPATGAFAVDTWAGVVDCLVLRRGGAVVVEENLAVAVRAQIARV